MINTAYNVNISHIL